MKNLVFLCVSTFTLLTSLACLAQTPSENPPLDCNHTNTEFRCVDYVKNYDGDTITVHIPDTHPLFGKNIGVRVLGLDTPEIKTKNLCEKAAGRIAQRLIENILKRAQRIDLRNVQRDKYFRILADVIADNRNLRDILLKEKLAYTYDGGKKEKIDWCNFRKNSATE